MTRIALWLGVVLLLAACGPGDAKPDSEQLRADTARIAQEYSAGGSLDSARDAINSLEVANPHQYLVLQAEEAIAANADPQTTTALVKLAVDMRLSSRSIQSYAAQNGLIAQAATATPAPTLAFGPRTVTPAPAAPAAPVAAADAAAPPAAEVAAAAPVTASTGTTPTQPLAAAPPITDTAALAVATATPAASAASTAASGPSLSSAALINVRSGPGVDFPVVDSLDAGASAAITGKDSTAQWWEVSLGDGNSGWVLAQLVTTSGDVTAVAVPADVPVLPPTATPAAVVAAPEAMETPTGTTDSPSSSDAATATPVPSGPDFRLVEKRLWDVEENGGRIDGPSIVCGEKRELHVTVVDASGNRLNGVAVQALLGAQEIIVTGSQGKGDGQSEFVLGGGQDITVIKDVDGRTVTADVASGLTTDPRNIPFENLIAGRYCSDNAACDTWVNNPYQPPPCLGHYSWSVTYKRNY